MSQRPESLKDRKETLLVPLGGLGNRYRFLGTVASSQILQCNRVTVLSPITDMFPGEIERYFHFPKNWKIRNIRIKKESLAIYICRLICVSHVIFPRKIASYGSRNLHSEYRFVASYNSITGYQSSGIELKTPNTKNISRPSTDYNAVHIRRTDNLRAISRNPISKFEEFIRISPLPVYVASDCEIMKAQMHAKFGGKVIIEKVGSNRASLQDLDAACEELFILKRAKQFIGSDGSSFSKLVEAMRDA